MKIWLKIALLFVIACSIAAGVYFSPFWTIVIGAYVLFGLMATYKVWLWAYLTNYEKAHETPVKNVEEGTGRLFMRNGKAWRFATVDRDTDPDENWNLPRESGDTGYRPEAGGIKTKQATLNPLAQWIDKEILPGGMRWNGFRFMGTTVWWYNFRWEVLRESEPEKDKDGRYIEDGINNCRQNEKSGKWVVSFAKRIDYIYLKDAVYYFEVVNAETKGRLTEAEEDTATIGMPLKLELVMTVQVVNPYLALIAIHDWLQSIQDLIRPAIRFWVSQNYYEDVITKPDVAEREFDIFLQQTGVSPKMLEDAKASELIKSERRAMTFAEYIERTYGVRIKRIGFDSIVPPDEYTEAAMQRVSAEQEKIRVETLAYAEANRQTIIADGEAKRIATVAKSITDGGDVAMRLRQLEALESVGENGNMVVVDGANQQLLVSPANLVGAKGKGGKP